MRPNHASGLVAGKVTLVTGGGAGIGQAASFRLANEGASVVVADIDADAGAGTVQQIQGSGGVATFVRTDVTSEADVEALVGQTIAVYGRLDAAFNNAGTPGAIGVIDQYSEEDWERAIDLNAKSTFLCMKHEIRAMLDNGGGAIVNCSATSGERGTPARIPAAVAAKHAIEGLTRNATLQYAGRGIRTNCIRPGWILSAAVRARYAAEPDQAKARLAEIPMERFGEPEELAEAVVWLCSDRASYVTGTFINLDGGYLSR